MQEKPNLFEILGAEEIASQLRQPEGETGIKVGESMNASNEHICKNAYLQASFEDQQNVLEIGMGNGLFIAKILDQYPNMNFTGADFSKTMVDASISNNSKHINEGRLNFVEASIESLPFDDNSFDRIVTVNTLYFWPNPLQNCKELLRILKPEGKLIIGYRHSDFMNKIPFTEFGFTKYTDLETEKLMLDAGFKNISTSILKEPELTINNQKMSMLGYFSSAEK